jgi:uncharacterized protein
METTFTPLLGLTGGALIGLAAGLFLLLNGRVAGISGVLGGSIFSARGDRAWRFTFIAGLPLGAALGTWLTGDALGFAIASNPALLIAGGLLVGVGTQLGSGCTSGHGVCGMARGSRRSIVATVTFMLVAGLTVYIARHLIGGL